MTRPAARGNQVDVACVSSSFNLWLPLIKGTGFNMHMTNQLVGLERVKEKAIDLSMEYGPKVLVAILILILGFFVGRWIAGVVGRWLSKLHLEPPVQQL